MGHFTNWQIFLKITSNLNFDYVIAPYHFIAIIQACLKTEIFK